MKFFGNSKKANESMQANVDLANKYAEGVGKLGYGNYMANNSYAKKAEANAQNLDLQTDEAIKEANKTADESLRSEEAKYASMGVTPATNNVYNEMEATNTAQKAQTSEQIRNEANLQQYNANQQSLNQAGNFTNTGYNNAMGAGNTAYGAKTGANNALAMLSQQRANNRMGLFGAGLLSVGA